MTKKKCLLFKGKKGAAAGKPVKATTDYSFTDLQNGTGSFGGVDGAGNPVPLDPAVWSAGNPVIAPDQTVISSVTISGLGITLVGTGKISVPGSPVQVSIDLTNSSQTPPVVDTITIPVDVTISAQTGLPVFNPGTPVVR